MKKILISISNDRSCCYNYHAWMRRVNEVLEKGNARVVSVICTNDEYKNATAYIEVETNEPQVKPRRKRAAIML